MGAAIRDLIRRDPELWTRVQADPALWQTFGFADQQPAADEEPGQDRA